MDDDNLSSMSPTTRLRTFCDPDIEPPYLTQEAVPLPPSPPLSPLPLPPSYSTSKWTSRQRSAYTICRAYEQSKLPSTSNVTADSKVFTPLVAARLLGWLLVCAPCVEGRDALAEDILECVDERGEEKKVEEEEALYALAVKWKRCFLRYFTAVKARTPTPDSPTLDLEKRVSEHSAVKAQALTRDKYHCLLKPSVLHQPAVAHGFFTKAQLQGCRMEYLRCVHIFPLGEADKLVRRYAGLIDEEGEEKHEHGLGHGHHELGNVLTLCSSAQADFCKMDVCLVPTDEEDRYDAKVFPPYLTSQYPSSTSFPSSSPFPSTQRPTPTTTTSSTTPFPLPLTKPSRNLLTLHATLTHALHISGAAAHLERAMRDLEETRVLRGDGGSVGVLVDALGCLGS